MKNVTKILILPALLCAALFSGCASTGERTVTKSDVITALEITAALTIGDDMERAQRALILVADARRYIGDGTLASADQVLDYALTQALRQSNLDIGQQMALRSFVAQYRERFTLELDQIGASEDVLLSVSEALDALESVATEVQTYGAAAPRSYE